MDIEDIRTLLDQLAAMMKDNKLVELEVEQNGLRIHLRKDGERIVAATVDPNTAGAPAAVGEGHDGLQPFSGGVEDERRQRGPTVGVDRAVETEPGGHVENETHVTRRCGFARPRSGAASPG